MKSFAELPTFDPETGDVLAVIETPKGSRKKYGYNEALEVFERARSCRAACFSPTILALFPRPKARMAILSTSLLLLDDPAPMGCVIRVRVVGAILADQLEDQSRWIRNDRLIAVATHAQRHGNVKKLKELNPRILDEMEAFFHQYNQMQDKEFRALDRCGPKRALELIENGRAKFANGKG